MVEGGLILPDEGEADLHRPMIWLPENFWYDMREAELRERVNRMDVAGRARDLVWGPYVALPAGRWRVTSRLFFDRWACRHRFRFEFGSSKDAVHHEFTPGREGLYELSLEHAWANPLKAEVRVIMVESSLGGVFEFEGAVVEFGGDAAPSARADPS